MAVKHVMRTMPSHGVDSFQKWGTAEMKLNEELQKCKANVHKALCGKHKIHSNKILVLFVRELHKIP